MALDWGEARAEAERRKRARKQAPVRGENAADKARTFTKTPSPQPQVQPLNTGPRAERNTPAFPGEKPAGYVAVPPSPAFPDGMKPIYQTRPERQKPAPEVLADRAMEQLQPALDRTPKVAKGVRVAEQVGEAFLPVSVLEGAAGRDVTAGMVALDVALGLPWVRGARAAGKGVSLADEIADAAPKPKVSQRTVKYGDRKQQFPASQSAFTRYAQRLWDKASERAALKADALKQSESPVARAAGTVITPATARARVPKQAGKLVKQESLRRRAAKAEEIRTVKKVGRVFPGLKTEPAQAAHWWLAQLPAEYRNAKGLGLIRDSQRAELARYTSGEFAKRLDAAEQAVRAKAADARAAGDTTEMFRLMGELEDISRVRADLPERIADLTEDIRKLDKLVAKPPEIDNGVIESLRSLMDDRQDILTRAGKLDPEVAAERTGLLSRHLGLEPTGEEVYLGHRGGRVPYQRPSGLPGGMSLGKTKLPQGTATKNRLTLVKTGRARKDLMAAVEDWQAAQVYEFHNIAKGELAQMGEPITGRPKKGYVVVNPRGHELPRTWKVDDEVQALAEGFDPEDILIDDVEEYLGNYLAQGDAAVSDMLRKAAEAGHLEDLRQVPEDVARRYFSQFLPTKINAATPGVKEGVSKIGRGADIVNDALYLSLIYSNPGYIPAGVAANVTMAALHQGVLLPVNLTRAGQLMAHGGRVRDQALTEVGGGMSTALASDTSPLRKAGDVVGMVADVPFRLSAFMHEAARAGVISKVSPRLTQKDYRALEDLLSNPAKRPLLNDVTDRAVQSMIDFNRLGSKERAFAKRLGFVWAFLRGAARYPARFALDHPGRTAALAAGGYLAQDEIRDMTMDDLPSWTGEVIEAGTTEVGGKRYPRGFQTRSYDPTSPPLDLLGTLIGDPDARSFFGIANPLIQAGVRVADRRNPNGFQAQGGYSEALAENAKRLVPWVERGKEYLNPPDDPGMYPEDSTRLGRIKRDLRVFPVAIDPEEAGSIRRKELERRGQGPKLRYKDQLKAIDKAVRSGEITEEDAVEFRASARATYEQELREKELKKRDLDDTALRRQLVIDDAVRQGMSLDEVNEFIADFGWKPVTADELEDTELDLLELRAVNPDG